MSISKSESSLLNNSLNMSQRMPISVKGTVKKMIQQFGTKQSTPRIDLKILDEIDNNLKKLSNHQIGNSNNNLEEFEQNLNQYFQKKKVSYQHSKGNKENKINEQDYYTFSFQNKNNQFIEKLVQVIIYFINIVQTGKFNVEQSVKISASSQIQSQCRDSIELTRFAAYNTEIPGQEDINLVIGLVLDSSDQEFQQLPSKYIDELKKLASIIMFRVRNRNQDLNF